MVHYIYTDLSKEQQAPLWTYQGNYHYTHLFPQIHNVSLQLAHSTFLLLYVPVDMYTRGTGIWQSSIILVLVLILTWPRVGVFDNGRGRLIHVRRSPLFTNVFVFWWADSLLLGSGLVMVCINRYIIGVGGRVRVGWSIQLCISSGYICCSLSRF